MTNLDTLLSLTKKLAFDNESRDIRCDRVWHFTNENVRNYIDLLTLNKTDRVLTVCSSGDQILNLVNKGITSIDAFDINALTYPFFQLKVAMMFAYGYRDFFKYFKRLSFDAKSRTEEYDIFQTIKPYLREPYASFWERLYKDNLEKNPSRKCPLLSAVGQGYTEKQKLIFLNPYLANPFEYEKTKRSLHAATINFKDIDVLAIRDLFTGPYDKIILSNIVDYLRPKDIDKLTFETFVSTVLDPILTEDGKVLLDYIFYYIDSNEFKDIYFLSGFGEDFEEFVKRCDMHTAERFQQKKKNPDYSADGVLIYQKKL